MREPVLLALMRSQNLYNFQIEEGIRLSEGPESSVTELLHQWRRGDEEALDRLTPLVYDELRRLARIQMRAERPDHTLQPTALAHEAYLRLADAKLSLRDRNHFLSVAAGVMRRVLVDHARARDTAKRGGIDKGSYCQIRSGRWTEIR